MSLYKQYPLSVQNNLTKQKEQFEPLSEGKVGMYVCGPTVYSDVHLGNVRTFSSFDIVYRYLTYLGIQSPLCPKHHRCWASSWRCRRG